MKIHLLSLGVGLLVGVIYALLNVRSPAPPVVALIGLLGILLGEQIVPAARHLVAGCGVAAAFGRAGCGNHVPVERPTEAGGRQPARDSRR